MTPAELPAGEAQLWLARDEGIRDPALLDAYHALLTSEESARQQRFHFERHRHQHLVTRALVRCVLSHYTGVPPADWRFEAGERGKPELVSPSGFEWLHFNLSHTDGLVACAVARAGAVGVDVEALDRKGETVAIADRYFSQSECEALHALPESQQRDRFFCYWTLKESYIKARGLGLAIPLGEFSFHVEEKPIRISFDPKLEDDSRDWQFHAERLSARHRLAFGVRRGRAEDLRLRVREAVPLTGALA